MDKKESLRKFLEKYPDHELLFLYPANTKSKHHTLAGTIEHLHIDKYCVYDDEIWLYYEDEKFFHSTYSLIFSREFVDGGIGLSKRQQRKVEERVKEVFNNQDWKDCIAVRLK